MKLSILRSHILGKERPHMAVNEMIYHLSWDLAYMSIQGGPKGIRHPVEYDDPTISKTITTNSDNDRICDITLLRIFVIAIFLLAANRLDNASMSFTTARIAFFKRLCSL